MDLPIDVVPNVTGLRSRIKFRWKQKVDSVVGTRLQDCEGSLPVVVEDKVAELIALVKMQEQEIIGLRRQVEGHIERIAAQSELLTKKAESNQRKGK